MAVDFSKLKRERYVMPVFMKRALLDSKLMDKYKERPAYQQNDYIYWISSPKREETKIKRMNEMLSDLKAGNVYMGMKYSPKSK